MSTRLSMNPLNRRILEYIEIGKKEATLAFQAKEVPPHGYFIPPTIFTDVKPHMHIAREEIFGPVLSASKARYVTKPRSREWNRLRM